MKQLVQHVISQSTIGVHSIHGPAHWARVERNGHYLCQFCDANPTVLSLFALLHDSMRLNDGHDPEHGERAADYAVSLRYEDQPSGVAGTLQSLSDDDFETLTYACHWHTLGNEVINETVGACWDSDRLDLGRVGIRPEASYLSIGESKRIAYEQDWESIKEYDKLDNCVLLDWM